MSRAAVNQVANIQFESSPGQAGTFTRRLVATKLGLNVKTESTRFAGSGYKVNTLTAQNQEWAEGDIEQAGTFEEVQYLLDSAFGKVNPTDAAGGTGLAKQRVWTPSSSKDTTSPQTWGIEIGDYSAAPRRRKAQYAICPDFVMEWDRQIITFKSRLFAQAVDISSTTMTAEGTDEVVTLTKTGTWSSGNFTLTFGGQTTGNIAYNADAATIELALRKLSSIGGWNVSVSCATVGGTINANPMIVRFQNVLGAQDVGAITFNVGTLAGSTPGLGIAVTTAGVAGVGELVVSQMLAKNINIYADDTFDAIGATKLLSVFAGRVAITNRYSPVWAVNAANASFKDHVEGENSAVSNLTLEADSVGESMLTTLRNGARKYMRLEVTGATIEGAIPRKLTVDWVASPVNPDDYAETQKVYALPWNFEVLHDRSFGGHFKATLVNTMTAN